MKEVGLQTIVNNIKFERDIFNPDLSEVSKGYFYVMPMQQNLLLGVRQEETFLQELLLHLEKQQSKDQMSSVKEIYFATAYFNPSLSLYDAMFRTCADKFTFLTSAKEANSFFGAPWPKGTVPHYYERLYSFMMKRAKKTVSDPERLR